MKPRKALWLTSTFVSYYRGKKRKDYDCKCDSFLVGEKA